MHRPTFAVLAACSALLAVSASASAQEVLIDLTFDGPPDPSYTYAYDYSGGGEPQTDHSALSSATSSVTGGGRGGGNSFNITGDFTGVPVMPTYNYKGIGGGTGVFRYDFETGSAGGIPSSDLSQYQMMVDLMGAGFAETDPAPVIEIQMQFQVPDDRITTDADTNFDPFFQVNYRVTPTTEYSTVSFTLDQGELVWHGSVPAEHRDIALHAADIGLLNPNFNFDANFGSDADNRLFVDNVRLTVVPEPASGLLLAAALGLGLSRRPRHARHV